ncbi:hypothetical protein EJ02DRAFT_430502 [Clathrospora elynae]|uniref:Retrovirus-related Pol polyprotein from transposon TNT 1-94-like beta-barrel domain-containing protein n=1 Tax=Clathrospora elynae TaxID=706981 RepID=A0A6A5T320_9PLEO|nr:hypothetical protein EJ02DRAFT_430502 [Clathrospora elynae]
MASLSALDDQVVSRASVILENQSDWKLWYSLKKQFATVKGTLIQRATLKAIGEVNLDIMRTVARSKLHLIADLDLDVRLRLKTLQDHFKITNQQQILELSSQYAAVQQKRKNQNVDIWLNEYSRITSLCGTEDTELDGPTPATVQCALRLTKIKIKFKAMEPPPIVTIIRLQKRALDRRGRWTVKLGMAEMKGTRPQWAFIQAVEAQGDADWSNQHFTLMIGCEEDNKTPPTLEALINRYRRWISTKRTHTKCLGSFAAKDGTQATQATQATLAITNARPNNRSRCFCSFCHNMLECYTLNLKAKGRPEGYQPSQMTIRKVQDSFKNPELLKKVKKLYKDNNVSWTFDTSQNSDRSERSERSENRADRPTSVPPGRRPHADRIDDDDSTRGYYANTAFHMAQITTPKGDTLIDRWIVDPGSNVHICNSTYFNWRKTSDARSTDVIFAGATSYQVAAWGEVIINVNRGNKKKDILMTQVAYVPGFLTNLFALSFIARGRTIYTDELHVTVLTRTIVHEPTNT